MSISPAALSVALGSQVGLAVRVADVLPGGLGSYDFNLGYDASILSFSRADDGMGLGLALGLSQNQLGLGLLSFADTSLESIAALIALQRPDFTLFTLYFNTLRTGSSALQFGQVTLNDAAGNAVAHTEIGGRVTVLAAQVAEPGTLGLLGAAALAAIAARQRKRRPAMVA